MRSDSSDSSGVRPKRARRRIAASDSSSSSSSPASRPRGPPASSDSGSDSEFDASSVGSMNDGLDADLMGDSHDRERLAQMTEKEREEELFKRAERREAMKARAMVKRKLKKKRRDGGAKNSEKKASSSPLPLTSASSATSDEDGLGAGVGVSGRSQRKASLQQSRRQQSRNSQLAALMARRKELAQKSKLKTSDIFSEESSSSSGGSSSEGEKGPSRRTRALSSESPNSSEVDEGREAASKTWLQRSSPEKKPVKKFYDSSVSSDLSEEDEEEVKEREARRRRKEETRRARRSPKKAKESHSPLRRRRLVCSSDDDDATRRSDAASSDDDDDSEEEREQEEKHVDCLSDLLKLRISRYRLAKWVHMPFFKELVIGLFVRVGIGRRPDQNLPVYRLGEIADVVETGKIYDVERSSTNKGLILRHAGDKAMFRLKFVSNQPFSQTEFMRWQRAMVAANLSTPTLSFVTEKVSAIRKAHQFRLDNERDLDLILAEKRRFQSRPRNYAMRKVELLKQRDEAEMEGDQKRIREIADEIAEVEREANDIDRRRSSNIKALTYINQRNRERNLQNAEEAIKLEAKEREELDRIGGDPFTRLKTRPVLLASGVAPPWLAERKSKQEAIAKEREKEREKEKERAKIRKEPRNEEDAVVKTGDFYSIHDFDVGVDISLAGEESSFGSGHAALVPIAVTSSDSPAAGLRPKTLNLEEYKKRRNLL